MGCIKVKLHCHCSIAGLRISFALVGIFLVSACATPGVTKGTGRVFDPPLDLIFYCLLNPSDPVCRSILR